MKKILIASIISLTATSSFCQSSWEQIRWRDKNLTLTILNSLPQEGDSIVGMRPFQLRFLNEQIVGLIKYKATADAIITQQEIVIGDYKFIIEKKDNQITNLEIMNKQTGGVWLKRGLGIGIAGTGLGLLLGLLLPLILN